MRVGDYTVRTDCRLCSGPIREVLRLPDTPLANEYPREPIPGGQDTFPLYLAQCEQCGHVQLPVVVDPKRLFPADYPYQSGTSPVFRAHLKEFAATVSGMIQEGGRVLEIASNDGTLLREFGALGHAITGVDPAAPVDPGKQVGMMYPHFFTRRFAEAVLCQHYEAIVALNVFAHVNDLNDFTAGVAELLAPDGVFVFEVGYLPDVIAKGLVGCIYHEHVSYHTLWPLFAFFERHGLRLVDAERIDSQGGSIRVFVKRNGQPSERLRGILVEENATHADPRKLRSAVYRNKLRVIDSVQELRVFGKRVAAFGAPAKLTTWAYALGLGPDDVTCVYDDNPLKVGRYTPGNFWPIVPSSRLLEDNPDAVILFSSNFADEIRERFKAYRGEWIVV